MSKSRLLALPTVLVLTLLTLSGPVSAATPIEDRYASDPALRDLCGDPISQEMSILDGALRHYENCTLYYSPATGVHEAHGVIRDAFRDNGGLQRLGFPTTDETDVWVRFESNVIGRACTFENATVTWSPTAGAHVLNPDMAVEWQGELANLLMPTDDIEQVPGGERIRFATGAIYSVAAHSCTLYEELHGYTLRIPKKWGSKGGAWSSLGLPVAELEQHADGVSQRFQHGAVYWEGDYELGTAKPDAYIVYGRILERYIAEGGPDTLGFPFNDQSTTSSGQIAHFAHADITWNESSDTTQVTPR